MPQRVRQVLNVLNLSTPLGLLVAAVGGTRLQRGPDRLVLARGYRLAVPRAPAFTVGDVVLLRLDDDALASRPRLLAHEARHAAQYAWCIGPVFLALYLVAAGFSWLRCRNFWQHNLFERWAGLGDGGYVKESGS